MQKRIICITTHETNLASGANDEKGMKKYKTWRAIEFPNFFKTKKLTNQIRAVLPLGYV